MRETELSDVRTPPPQVTRSSPTSPQVTGSSPTPPQVTGSSPTPPQVTGSSPTPPQITGSSPTPPQTTGAIRKLIFFKKVILKQQNAYEITGSDVAYGRNLISTYRKP
jgi:hypothetical protein